MEIPEESAKYLVEKGSIALNGVSLTLAEVAGPRFVVWLIPHTLRLTNLGDLAAGAPLNVEIDLLAKHVGKTHRGLFAKGRDLNFTILPKIPFKLGFQTMSKNGTEPKLAKNEILKTESRYLRARSWRASPIP